MLIVYVIRTVPERGEMYRDTLSHLQGEHVLTIVDKIHRGIRWASIEGLDMAMNTPADWIVVLDDDFRYCRNFAGHISSLAKTSEMRALILYSMAKPRNRVVEGVEPFHVRKADRRHLLCVPMLRRDAARILCDALRDSNDPTAFDGTGARAIHDAGLHYGVVWPNPVDHIGKTSVIGNSWRVGGRERVSAWFEDSL